MSDETSIRVPLTMSECARIQTAADRVGQPIEHWMLIAALDRIEDDSQAEARERAAEIEASIFDPLLTDGASGAVLFAAAGLGFLATSR